MTAGGGGAGGKPPPDWESDPLHRPASDAGWDDERPRPAAPPTPPSPTGAASSPAAPRSHAPTTPGVTAPSAPDAPVSTSASPLPAGAAASPASAHASPAGAAASRAAQSSTPRGISFPAYAPAAPAPLATSTSVPAATSSSAAPASPAPASSPPASPAPASPGAARTVPASTAARPAGAADDPTLPSVPDKFDVNELRAAVGATPLAAAADNRRAAPSDDDDDDEPDRRRSPKTIAIAALGITAVVGIAVLVVLGYLNSDRYVLACEAERAVPEQGRGFPPWGTRAMTGEAWRPLKIAPETRCQPHETDDPLVLERAFLAMVLDQATGLLTAREVTRIDEAEVLLKQALLLTRPREHEAAALAGQRTEHHQEIEHLLGDVTYWRATAKLRDAAAALGDAAKQFDAAVAQHPRHASDAGAWAAYSRKLAQELRAGPTGAPALTATPPATPSAAPPAAGSAAPAGASDHPGAPLGTALPVEPDKPSAPATPEAAPPDAGAPTGGVLL